MSKRIILFISVVAFAIFTGCSKEEKYSKFSPKSFSFIDYKETQYPKEKLTQIEKNVVQNITANNYAELKPVNIYLANQQATLRKKKKDFQTKINQNTKQIKELNNFNTITQNKHWDVNDIVINKDKVISVSDDRTIKIWDLKTGKLLNTLSRYNDEIWCVDSHDDIIVTGDRDYYIKLWSLKTGKLLKTIKAERSPISAVVLTKTKIISGSYGSIKIWSRKTGKLLKSIKLPRGYVKALAVQNGKIYANDNKHSVNVWDLNTGKLLQTFTNNTSITALTLTSDKLITADMNKIIKIWDLNSTKLLAEFSAHRYTINQLAFYNNKLVSVSNDDTIKIWDMNSSKLLKTLTGHKNNINTVAIANDTIITGSDDNTIKFWDIKDLDNKLAKENELTNENKQLNQYIEQINKLLNYTFSYTLDDLKLSRQTAYKYGKIGEYYVPSTTYSSSTPKTQTTYINGNAYTKTTYTNNTSTGGGYTAERKGYKAIIKVTNNPQNYYLLTLKATWKGKYTTVRNYKENSWSGSGDYRNKWGSEYQNGSLQQDFLLKPNDNYKFQTEVGETEAKVTTEITNAFIIDKEYYEALVYALDRKNRALKLIDKFLKDSRLSAWHERLKTVHSQVKEDINEEFSKKHIEGASVRLVFPTNYDPDFENTINVEVTAGSTMCVHYKAPFGKGKLMATNGFFSKTGIVEIRGIKNISKDSTATVTLVTETCD